MSNPKEDQLSIFYHVPIELIDQLKKYRTRGGRLKVFYRYRKPKKGKSYGLGGNVRREDAQVASIYVSSRECDHVYNQPIPSEEQAYFSKITSLQERLDWMKHDRNFWRNSYQDLAAWWPVRFLLRFFSPSQPKGDQ